MTTHPTGTGRLVELSSDECWDLAGTVPVGRLAWTGPHAPVVVPMNFALDGRSVRIRTTAYSAAARECDESQVAFQVDLVDPGERQGWSVLFQGTAHFEYGAADPAATEPWLRGPRTLSLRIDVDTVSGRRLVSG